MGADMFLGYCEIPRKYEEQEGLILKRIRELDDNVITCMAECYPFIEEEISEFEADPSANLSEEDLFKINNLVKLKTREIVSNHLIKALEELFGASSYNRDVTEICIKDTWFAFSGGLSWGGSPSESYELISLVSDSEVTVGLGSS